MKKKNRSRRKACAFILDLQRLFVFAGYGQGPSAAWTVEKHRLYLDSLEASFVNKQLRHSFSLRCWWREMGGRPCSSQPQFMVLRHCRWEKKMNEPLLESTADSRRQLGGQTGGRRLIMIFKDTLLLVAGGFVTIEVSDQNFVEEHQGEELTCIHMLKRSGRSGAGASRNDKKI
ncbi:hypothetical protein D5086_008870 [Populus alba]|uniref:Uncharacterized protein n=1 Tax=Populus alba TaxID=43335 RepID=A0ACC4CGP6_POPAL